MIEKLNRLGAVAIGGLCVVTARAQVADLLNTFDAGSRSIGLGSSLTATDAETLSTYNNPAALGYINHQEIGISYRNFPRSSSSVADLNGDRSSTSTHSGPSNISNLGFAFPLSTKSNRGTIGISYSVGGYVDDDGSNTSTAGLPYGSSGTLVAGNYTDHIEARTDYFSVGYGKTNPAQTLSYGVSLLYARESIQYRQAYGVYDTSTGSDVLVSNQDTGLITGTSNGVGLVAGLEYVPPTMQSLTFGASIKSPIKLSGGGGVTNYYDTIPGRLLVGEGWRLPGLKSHKDDYIVIGAQFEDFFGGSGSGVLSQQNFGAGDFGIEYGYSADGYLIPVRLGYRAISSEGPQFANRNELTYGFGFRDKDGKYGIDFSWASPTNAARDFSVTATYRFINP